MPLENGERKRLKVLFLASWYPNKEHSISGIFIKRHAQAVSKYCETAVLYVHLGSIEDSVEILKDDGIPVVMVYRKKPKYTNSLMQTLYDYVLVYIEYILCGLKGYGILEKEFGTPDIVHVNVALNAGLVGLALKILKGLPYIMTEHWAGYLKENGTFEKRSPLGKSIIRAIGNKAEAIITVSRSLRDAMKDCGIDNTFFVIPNVVDARDSPINPACISDKKKIIHVSLLKDDVKNVSGIIEAARILSQKRSDFELHLIGDGDDRKKLEDMARNYGLFDNVIFFHGLVSADKVKVFIQSSDFSVINSNFETFCVSAAESLAWGKPVISTRCGGPEEFVNDKCGILVERKDTEDLVKAMDYMLDNVSKYDSREIAEYAMSRFSSEEVGKEIYEIYKEILKIRN